MLFLNVDPYLPVAAATFGTAFLYMFFLMAIVSVQMFNAIINYSYNRSSEEMQPVFDKAKREKKSKERQLQELKMVLKYIGKCWRGCMWIFCNKGNKKKQKHGEKEDSKDDRDAQKEPAAKPESKEELDVGARKKVTGYLVKNQIKAPQESCKSMLYYLVFLICFFMFLLENLDVSKNGRLRSAVMNAIGRYHVEIQHPGGGHYGLALRDVHSIDDMARWMVNAVPEYTHPTSNTANPELGLGSSNTTLCINMWNCIFTGPMTSKNGPGPRKMLRITAREHKFTPNRGGDSTDSDKKFAVGPQLLSARVNQDPLIPQTTVDYENGTITHGVMYNGEKFCSGSETEGYHRLGGIVCFLDADKKSMIGQLLAMSAANVLKLSTGVMIIEMVLYNANTNALAYSQVIFTVMPTGLVLKENNVYSVKMTRLEEFKNDASLIDNIGQVAKTCWQRRLVWGLIYICLCLYFIAVLINDIHKEMVRNYANEGQGYIRSAAEYFFDPFHCLDLFSMSISVISFFYFMFWVARQGKVGVEVNGSFAGVLSFVEEMCNDGNVYVRFSSVNLMLAFWRILKYTRQVPQMGQLNDTFFKASEDIFWFLVMLLFFFLGFVFFAHFSFGVDVIELSEVWPGTFVYCFEYLIGEFSFLELFNSGNPFLAVVFFISYLFLFKLFFLNIFFAIIDRFFVSKDVPPVDPKKLLYPFCNRICRSIEWKDDYRMQQQEVKQEDKPPTRADMVHKTALKIQDIRDQAADGGTGGEIVRKSKLLNDVCDPSEQMQEVMRWSKDEARHFTDTWKKLQQEKQAYNNDEGFLSTKLAVEIAHSMNKAREAMEMAERSKRYHVQVNEGMVRRDQVTLAKYIMRLENKIEHKMIQKHSLLTDVYHLRAESEKMRFSDEDLKKQQEERIRAMQAATKGNGIAEDAEDHAVEDKDSDDSSKEDIQEKDSDDDVPITNGHAKPINDRTRHDDPEKEVGNKSLVPLG